MCVCVSILQETLSMYSVLYKIHHQVAKWHSLTVWHCDRGAEVVFGGQLQFHDFVALDNQRAGMEMVKVSGGYGEDDGPG